MTPRERMLAALRGDRADRVPMELYGFWLPDRDAVETIDDPLKREIAERIIDELVFRTKVDAPLNRLLGTPPQRIREEHRKLPNGNTRTFGTIDTPKGELTFVSEEDPVVGTTWMVKYPIEGPRDIDAILSVPWELPEGLVPPDGSERTGDFETRGICEAGVSSPMVWVGGTMSYQGYLELCATDLRLVKEMTDLCVARALACLEVLLSRPGVDLVWMGGSEWLTPPMGSPALYDALVQEQERAMIDYVHTNSDAVVQVHCHGRVGTVLEKTIARGADYTEPVEPPPDGDITLADAKALAAGRITLGGNIETRVMANETEEVVEHAVRAAFDGGKERFILVTTAGCSPTLSDREFRNYMRLVDVWEELSPI